MPGYRGHIAGGIVAYVIGYLVITHYIRPTSFVAAQWAIICILGSLFPDVDIKSKGQGIFYRLLALFLIYLSYKRLWQLFVVMSFLALLPILSRHRGLFHKLWFVGCVPFAVALAVWTSFPEYALLLFSSAFFFALGSVSHILLDRG